MRLPSRRVYRAFPELDRFDDAACRRFARAAMRMPKAALAVWVVGTVAVALGAGFGLFVGGMLLVRPYLRGHPSALRGWGEVVVIVVIVLAAAVTVLLPLVVRDWVLRRRIGQHIKSWKCTCGYFLLGLVPRDGALKCPECGEMEALVDRGTDEAGYRSVISERRGAGGGGWRRW